MPVPPSVEYHTHHHANRGEVMTIVLFTLLVFVLGATAIISTNLALSSTLDRLTSVPMCKEATK
jgi:hypothetical protein